MTIRKIATVGHPVLRERARDVSPAELASPDVQKALAAQGFRPMIGSAEEFDAFYRAERAKWAKVIKASGMDKE